MKAEFQSSFRAPIVRLLALNKPLLVCTIYDHIPGLPPKLDTALGTFNDVILREAIQQGLSVLDLRMICTEPGDYLWPPGRNCRDLAGMNVRILLTPSSSKHRL